MKKTGAKITKSRLRSHPPIVMSVTDKGDEIAVRLAVSALIDGTGNARTLDVLLTHLHLLQFGADSKGNKQAKIVCDVAAVALESVLDRYRNTDRVGATGEERKAIEMLVFESIDFWKRQSGTVRDACVVAVNGWYSELERAAA